MPEDYEERTAMANVQFIRTTDHRVTVAVAEYDGHIAVGISRVSPDDKYDEQVGEHLAGARALQTLGDALEDDGVQRSEALCARRQRFMGGFRPGSFIVQSMAPLPLVPPVVEEEFNPDKPWKGNPLYGLRGQDQIERAKVDPVFRKAMRRQAKEMFKARRRVEEARSAQDAVDLFREHHSLLP